MLLLLKLLLVHSLRVGRALQTPPEVRQELKKEKENRMKNKRKGKKGYYRRFLRITAGSSKPITDGLLREPSAVY